MQAPENLGRDQVGFLHDMFVASPSFSALLRGADHRYVLVNPVYQRLIGERSVIGLTVQEALPEVAQQGYVEVLDRVFASGEPFIGRDVPIELQRGAGEAELRYVDFVFQPIKDDAGTVASIFIEGTDITDRHDTETALRSSESRLRQLNAELERKVTERAQARAQTWSEPLPAGCAQLRRLF